MYNVWNFFQIDFHPWMNGEIINQKYYYKLRSTNETEPLLTNNHSKSVDHNA